MVRRMHRTPTGPAGTAIIRPTTIPFNKKASIRTQDRKIRRQSPEMAGHMQSKCPAGSASAGGLELVGFGAYPSAAPRQAHAGECRAEQRQRSRLRNRRESKVDLHDGAV